jgi:glycosyltransferase involved in cell wall biosynthesis
MLNPPSVSVVMAVKNGEPYLDGAIESVLAQTQPAHELVVVDGASTDRSAEIARSHPNVRCVEQVGNTGFAGAWNEGVQAGEGDLLAFIDSDDLWGPEKLEKQVALLSERPEVDYVISRVRFFLEPGHACPPGFDPELLKSDHVAWMPSALLIRRSAFDAVGPFRTDLSITNDIDWFARAKDLPLTLGTVPQVLVHKRVHGKNLSYTAAENMNRELLGLLRDSVARRRA